MSEEKKQNIVKKVFERSGARPDRISPLFTHFKNPQKKAKLKSAKAEGLKSNAKRLPVAIDFGVSRIKLLQLAQDPKGAVEVVLMDEELLSQEPGRAEIVKSKQALEKLLSRNPVGAQVIVGLPAKETQTFNFTFPAMADEELREAVRWKIKQLRPFDLDEDKVKYALLRWETVSSATVQGAQQRVTVVCVSNNNLSWKTTLLNEVGLKPVSVQISPLSLVHTKRTSSISKNPDEVVLWLDLGSEESVFIVEKNGIVYFLRNLTVTGSQMTRQVAQNCRVDEQKAEELKIEHGLNYWSPQFQNSAITDEEKAKDPSASVCLALVSLLENLVLDVEHSFKSFSYQVSQSQIAKFDRVILTGGAANLKKIENFLADRLSVPVDKLDPFFSLRVQETLKNQRRNIAEDGLRFASAAGLALTQLPGAAGALNLAASDKKKRVSFTDRVKARPRLAGAIATAVCLLAVAPQVAFTAYYKNQADVWADRVKEARADLKRRQTGQLELAEQEKKLLERKAALEDKLALFRQSGRDKRRFSAVLGKLASLLPDEIWVTKLSYAEKRLIIVASTSKNDAMIRFLDNLKKPDDFSDVVFNYTKRDPKSSVFSFEVMMSVK